MFQSPLLRSLSDGWCFHSWRWRSTKQLHVTYTSGLNFVPAIEGIEIGQVKGDTSKKNTVEIYRTATVISAMIELIRNAIGTKPRTFHDYVIKSP